jgi:hypothetical protein
MSATIRDNILFSHAYDETFYNLVLDGMCSIYIRLLHVYLSTASLRAQTRFGSPVSRRSDRGG